MTETYRQVIEPSPAGYSQAIRVGDTVYCAGQVSSADGIEAQAREAFGRLRAVLAQAGAGMGDIVKLTVYTTDEQCWTKIAAVRAEFLQEPCPAATMPVVRALAAPALLIELDAIAVIGAGRAA